MITVPAASPVRYSTIWRLKRDGCSTLSSGSCGIATAGGVEGCGNGCPSGGNSMNGNGLADAGAANSAAAQVAAMVRQRMDVGPNMTTPLLVIWPFVVSGVETVRTSGVGFE